MEAELQTLKRLCAGCRHYHVTWDPSAPYGCRAMGFKSNRIPSMTVYESSGLLCQLFEPKEKKKLS